MENYLEDGRRPFQDRARRRSRRDPTNEPTQPSRSHENEDVLFVLCNLARISVRSPRSAGILFTTKTRRREESQRISSRLRVFVVRFFWLRLREVFTRRRAACEP